MNMFVQIVRFLLWLMAELSPLDLVCLFAFAGKMSFLFGKKTGWLFVEYFADVVKLVDTPDLGSGAERCESSSLSVRTIYIIQYLCFKNIKLQ